MTTSFVTTAIPFVNARPHLGFAYELVLGDALARHRRRRGRDVYFVNGTDENSLKSVAAAAREGVPVRDLVERNAGAFRALGPLLDVAPDDFVRTSEDPRHRPTVEGLWRACAADLYRQRWTGLYCAGCEAFVDEREPCTEHDAPPEPIAEENWFFRLSRWREPIRRAIESGRLAIVPEAARSETLAFLDEPVRDLSVSRDAARAGGWGLPVPGDPGQVIYVWFDALASYLTALDGERRARYWSGDGERVHVIGKGISRFHAVYWPAFLLSAGLPLPDKIFVHGYLTVDGQKIKKSADEATRARSDVAPAVEAYGTDALRWYFLRRCRTRGDSDVARATIAAAHDGDLVDRCANLVHRCASLAARIAGGRVPEPRPETADEAALRALGEALPGRVDAAVEAFLPDEALGAILELVDAANRAVQQRAPWELARIDREAAAASLYAPLEAARLAAGELAPFVPGVARALARRLGDPGLATGWGGLRPGAPLADGPPPVPRVRCR